MIEPLCRAGLALAAAAALTAGVARADILAEARFDSPRLGRAMSYAAYLPPGYPEPGRRYPVLFLLHGLGDDHRTWTRAGIEASLDALIGAGGAAPLIVVMPDAGRSWYGDARDGPGRVRSALREDLVAHVDARFPTDGRRGIAGHSMGAQGALSIAFQAPDVFEMAAATNLSPGSGFVARVLEGDPVSDDRARHVADLPETLALAPDPAAAPRVWPAASDDDPYDTHLRSVELYRALRERGVEPELRITDGGHSWVVWRAELQRIVSFFVPPSAEGRAPPG